MIKTNQGIKWLTIPVNHEGLNQLIKDTKISDKRWNKKHWKTLKQSYAKANCFSEYKDFFEELYLNSNDKYLCDVNYRFIIEINKLLGINTKINWSSNFKLLEGKTERLIGLCLDCNADVYLSGPSAKEYFDKNLAKEKKIKVEWVEYSGYKEYEQMHFPFNHNVSILDLIFNKGKDAIKYMKSFKK